MSKHEIKISERYSHYMDGSSMFVNFKKYTYRCNIISEFAV